VTEPTADAVPEVRPVIDAELVRRLVADQFPQWASLPVIPVEYDGWDNRTFHLGDSMSVRLPSAAGYAAQVAKENRWLPYLAPQLPLPIPSPLARGLPGEGYPFDWSVLRWLSGQTAAVASIHDRSAFARSLADFLTALQAIDASDGPAAGAHSFFRGGALSTYDDETRRAIDILGDGIDAAAATEVWDTALASTWTADPVWFHGDVASGNLLVDDGRLAAVIDFGCSGVGDPACDLAIAWTFFDGQSREEFRAGLPLDAATWERGRGWTLWKALITVAGQFDTDPAAAGVARHVLDAVIADHRRHE